MTKPIQLPDAEQLHRLLRYDAETGLLYWRDRECKRWSARYAGKEAAYTVAGGYRRACIFGHLYLAHRVIWKMVTGSDPNGQIDHRDGDKLNNRISNLREVTNLGNARNRRPYGKSTSGHLGVAWRHKNRKWIAYISSGGRVLHLGSFEEKDDAIAARKAAEVKYGYGA